MSPHAVGGEETGGGSPPPTPAPLAKSTHVYITAAEKKRMEAAKRQEASIESSFIELYKAEGGLEEIFRRALESSGEVPPSQLPPQRPTHNDEGFNEETVRQAQKLDRVNQLLGHPSLLARPNTPRNTSTRGLLRQQFSAKAAKEEDGYSIVSPIQKAELNKPPPRVSLAKRPASSRLRPASASSGRLGHCPPPRPASAGPLRTPPPPRPSSGGRPSSSRTPVPRLDLSAPSPPTSPPPKRPASARLPPRPSSARVEFQRAPSVRMTRATSARGPRSGGLQHSPSLREPAGGRGEVRGRWAPREDLYDLRHYYHALGGATPRERLGLGKVPPREGEEEVISDGEEEEDEVISDGEEEEVEEPPSPEGSVASKDSFLSAVRAMGLDEAARETHGRVAVKPAAHRAQTVRLVRGATKAAAQGRMPDSRHLSEPAAVAGMDAMGSLPFARQRERLMVEDFITQLRGKVSQAAMAMGGPEGGVGVSAREAAQMIIHHYQEGGHIREAALNLGHFRLQGPKVEALARCLPMRDFAFLKHLELQACSLVDSEAAPLMEAVLKTPSLLSLNLSDNQIGARGIEPLRHPPPRVEGIRGPVDTLVELDVSNNPLGDAGVEAVASGVVYYYRELKVLRLSGVGLREGVLALAEALEHNQSVSKVDLSHNSLGARGVAHLAASLGQGITQLSLGHCGMGDGGCFSLVEALWLNKSVRCLALEGNGLGPSSCQVLAALMVRRRKQYVEVDLQHNPLRSGLRSLLYAATEPDSLLARLCVLGSGLVDVGGQESKGGGGGEGGEGAAARGQLWYNPRDPNHAYCLDLGSRVARDAALALLALHAAGEGRLTEVALDGRAVWLGKGLAKEWPEKLPPAGVITARYMQLSQEAEIKAMSNHRYLCVWPDEVVEAPESWRLAYLKALASAVHITSMQGSDMVMSFAWGSSRLEVLLTLFGRLEDAHNAHRLWNDLPAGERMEMLKGLGILGVFNPTNPTARYALNLSRHLDHTVARRLLVEYANEIKAGICKPPSKQYCWRNVTQDGVVVPYWDFDPKKFLLARRGMLRFDYVSYNTAQYRGGRYPAPWMKLTFLQHLLTSKKEVDSWQVYDAFKNSSAVRIFFASEFFSALGDNLAHITAPDEPPPRPPIFSKWRGATLVINSVLKMSSGLRMLTSSRRASSGTLLGPTQALLGDEEEEEEEGGDGKGLQRLLTTFGGGDDDEDGIEEDGGEDGGDFDELGGLGGAGALGGGRSMYVPRSPAEGAEGAEVGMPRPPHPPPSPSPVPPGEHPFAEECGGGPAPLQAGIRLTAGGRSPRANPARPQAHPPRGGIRMAPSPRPGSARSLAFSLATDDADSAANDTLLPFEAEGGGGGARGEAMNVLAGAHLVTPRPASASARPAAVPELPLGRARPQSARGASGKGSGKGSGGKDSSRPSSGRRRPKSAGKQRPASARPGLQPARPDSAKSSKSAKSTPGDSKGRKKKKTKKKVEPPPEVLASLAVGEAREWRGKAWTKRIHDEQGAVNALRLCATEMHLSPQQLRRFLDLFEPDWEGDDDSLLWDLTSIPKLHRVEVAVTFFTRLTTHQYLNRVLLTRLSLREQVVIARRLGWLTLLDMAEPDRKYLLRMNHPDERETAYLLWQLAVRTPGWNNFGNLQINGHRVNIREDSKMWVILNGSAKAGERSNNVLSFTWISSPAAQEDVAVRLLQHAARSYFKKKAYQRNLAKVGFKVMKRFVGGAAPSVGDLLLEAKKQKEAKEPSALQRMATLMGSGTPRAGRVSGGGGGGGLKERLPSGRLKERRLSGETAPRMRRASFGWGGEAPEQASEARGAAAMGLGKGRKVKIGPFGGRSSRGNKWASAGGPWMLVKHCGDAPADEFWDHLDAKTVDMEEQKRFSKHASIDRAESNASDLLESIRARRPADTPRATARSKAPKWTVGVEFTALTKLKVEEAVLDHSAERKRERRRRAGKEYEEMRASLKAAGQVPSGGATPAALQEGAAPEEAREEGAEDEGGERAGEQAAEAAAEAAAAAAVAEEEAFEQELARFIPDPDDEQRSIARLKRASALCTEGVFGGRARRKSEH